MKKRIKTFADSSFYKKHLRVMHSPRNFELIAHAVYPPNKGAKAPIVRASSAIGRYPDAFQRPGSSYLFIGDHHHLCREQIAELVGYLQNWLKSGHLKDRVE
jgi:hypothetical protein